ncbi:transcription intermediary factor 1-alpha-like isoform X2 [Haliotis rubra]|nr:transcription intermediary factor 1-alpha-like isoform X2 [Haliotis rubra]XP_046561294.1 transcription intermediary factor 1-alpha-like isoform X2 [Haliotis rubra]XP_046561295.1 transcription intermediary factor 1-alpha-like isoform X2 [Haliotis rubra]
MDIFPKCSVCQQQFVLKGPAPYLLPCLHAVCETCVTSAGAGVISCSTCQREVNLTDTRLKKDAVRQKEIFHLTAKHRPTELLCTHEDDSNQAVCWCRQCEELLCEYCQNMHSSLKPTRKHVLQNLSDFKPVVSNIPTPCSIHNPDSLYLFDLRCNILICGRCRFEDHADHEVEKLDVVAESILKQLDQHKTELATLHARQQSNIQNIRRGTEITDTTHNTLKENIGHTFRVLRSQLDQREEELLTDLEGQTKATKTSLRTQLNTCEEASKKCSEVLDYVTKVLTYASQSDLLELESSVREATRAFLDTAETQTQDIPAAVFNTNGLSKLKSNISRFGAVLTKDMEKQYARDKETQTEHDFIAEMEIKYKNSIDENENIVKRASETTHFMLGLLNECDVHLLKSDALDKSMVLKCIHLKYDTDKINLDEAHINTEGDLINSKSATRSARKGRLKKYRGTCSTIPLPLTDCPQYWETETRVGLDKTLTGSILILEVGVCAEGEMDMTSYVARRPHAYSLIVRHCTTHEGICRVTWKEGKEVTLHLPYTIPNTAGAPHTLHYGVVYDDARKKIVFIDVKEKKAISTLDNVDSSQPLRPVFGLYSAPVVTVSMRLVVGSDINMTEEKKAMIVKALS